VKKNSKPKNIQISKKLFPDTGELFFFLCQRNKQHKKYKKIQNISRNQRVLKAKFTISTPLIAQISMREMISIYQQHYRKGCGIINNLFDGITKDKIVLKEQKFQNNKLYNSA
jgi:hypothetical protein